MTNESLDLYVSLFQFSVVCDDSYLYDYCILLLWSNKHVLRSGRLPNEPRNAL